MSNLNLTYRAKVEALHEALVIVQEGTLYTCDQKTSARAWAHYFSEWVAKKDPRNAIDSATLIQREIDRLEASQ